MKKLEGTIEMTHKGCITPREERQGYILACWSRMTGDVQVTSKA